MASNFRSSTRLLVYAKRFRMLVAMTITMGVLGFAISFIFPWLIGTAIERVALVGPAVG